MATLRFTYMYIDFTRTKKGLHRFIVYMYIVMVVSIRGHQFAVSSV